MAPSSSNPQRLVSRARHVAGLVLQAVSDLRRWTMASRARAVIVASGAIVLLTLMIVVWTLLAERVVDQQQQATLADALQALDAKRLDVAREWAESMLDRPALPPKEYSGPPFILGAIKSHEAAQEPSGRRRQAAYRIAATYLQEAAQRGFPPGRDAEGLFLLGLSLMEAHEYERAQPILEEALEQNPQESTRLHRLLTIAYLEAREPNLEAAERHSAAELADRMLAPHVRARAVLRRGEILLQQNELDEVAMLLDELPEEIRSRPVAQMLQARLQMARAAALEERLANNPQDTPEDPAALYRSAITILRDLQAAARQDGDLARGAMYLVGACYARVPDEAEAALEQFSRVRKLYAGTAEGVAASLAEAELLERLRRTDEAVTAYQRTLRAVGDPRVYRNRWLTLDTLRKHILSTVDSHLAAGRFEEALALVEAFRPTFDKVTTLAQRADAYRAWAEHVMQEAEGKPQTTAPDMRRRARALFRRAAHVYEELSDARVAEREYPDDLWQAIESNLDGHSYSAAIRLLEVYLAREAVLRRPLALVSLGKAYLAVGDLERAIAAFQECIELHGRDATVYSARLYGARAYYALHEPDKAAELLRANLTAPGLTPRSLEWRESLLELGKLDYAEGRYEEAIQSLREYVERYDQEDPDSLFARYLVAQSYRYAAREPLARLESAITENERIKHRLLAEELSHAALEHFSQVQRALTLKSSNDVLNPLEEAMLRNCYLFRGDVLFSLREYEQALDVYRNASSLYQNDPVALDAYLQIAACHRRLGQLQEARGAVEQAKIVLSRLPEEEDFTVTTSFGRDQWGRVLNEMSQW